ncbi:tetratricopeptide repeat-containing sensor histidine kinase [Jejuia spongiicola]|uniref:histidine kinase n=1 Tax=Jejuia spongiicola TaxID=2942207 RepID=A0ABT0QC96_9FLAO|nr:sensor histidine kinase [Jejuia spongiicola]MCL6294519.1 sensor histidine kinase [Jejuia spongiicola]
MKNFISYSIGLLFLSTTFAQNDSLQLENLYENGIKYVSIKPNTSQSNFIKALDIVNTILNKKPANSYFLLKKASILQYLCEQYRLDKEYVSGLKAIQESLRIGEILKDSSSLTTTYNQFGRLFQSKRDSLKAKKYYDKAFALLAIYPNDKEKINLLNNYSSFYIIYEDNELSKLYAEQALSYADSIHYLKGKANALAFLARYERAKKNYKKSLSYSLKNLEISSLINDKIGMERSYKNSGYAYRKLNNPKTAIHYYKKSLDLLQEMEITGRLANRYLALSNAHSDLKQHETAFSYYRLYKRQQIKDLNVKSIREFAELDIKYQYKKEKLKDSLLFVQEKKLSEAKIETLYVQNRIKKYWILFGGIGLLALFLIIYLTRTRKFAMSKQALQEQFSQELINQQEKERSRLARDLHDSVGQKLMLLSKTTKNLGDKNAEQLANSTLEEVRTISRGLHPSNLERLGLTEAINALLYDINANTDLFFTDEIENIDNLLSKASELHLYRIIQETLSNIVKHAEARAVKMNITKTTENINVTVSDNGKGFDFKSKYRNMSLGLKTLLERAKIMNAQINLNSNKGKGTILTLNIPI